LYIYIHSRIDFKYIKDLAQYCDRIPVSRSEHSRNLGLPSLAAKIPFLAVIRTEQKWELTRDGSIRLRGGHPVWSLPRPPATPVFPYFRRQSGKSPRLAGFLVPWP
jgi:hypothetical protein